MTPTPQEPTRVFLIEGNPLVRAGIGAVLTGAGARLVGEVPDAEAGLELVESARPHVVLVDVDTPGKSETSVVRSLVRRCPAAGVIVTAAARAGQAEYVAAALSAGAKGFLPKDVEPDLLLSAIRVIGNGGVVLGPGIGPSIAPLLAPVAGPIAKPVFPSLTVRERDVLRLVAHGFDNRHIARELTLSDKTVRNYVSAVMTKLGAGSRGEAIVTARAAGMARAGEPAYA